jgi:hypothetical protein
MHFELMFVTGERQGSSFIPLYVDIQFSWCHWLKTLYYQLYWKISWLWICAVTSRLLCSIDPCICFYANTILFWWLQPCSIFWRQCNASCFVLFFCSRQNFIHRTPEHIYSKKRTLTEKWKTNIEHPLLGPLPALEAVLFATFLSQ